MAHVDHDQVERLVENGHGLRDIAQILGCSTRQVSRIKRRRGLSAPPRPPITADELATAKRLIDDGASLFEAARTVGRAPEVLRLRFPDYVPWTREQVSAYGKLRRLERQL